MFRKAVTRAASGAQLQWARMLASNASSPINTLILQSLKEHYLEVSRFNLPPKVSPPSPFTIVKGSLDRNSPVLKRVYNKENISISVMRLTNIIPEAAGDDDSDGTDDTTSQLFLHVDISKPGEESNLHFLCGLYPDAIGIHSVSLKPKGESTGFFDVPKMYSGPVFQDVDEKVKDALHGFIEERGIDESLFEFLRAWLYVKDHQRLLRWFKTIGEFVKDDKITASSS